MSQWADLRIPEEVSTILEKVAADAPNHHFGPPLMTAYQLAIAFEMAYPTESNLVDLPLGGAGTGRRKSLTQCLSRFLSEDIKNGRMPGIEGRFLAHLHVHGLTFDHDGEVVMSSVTDSQYGLYMFRARRA